MSRVRTRGRPRGSRWSTMPSVLAVVALITAACMGPGTANEPSDELVVHAASSLTEVFTDLAADFEDDHPGVTVTLNLAGSQALATQVEQGAPGGVLATADEVQMGRVRDLLDEAPTTFATNRLVVVTPADDRAGISSLADLARPDVTVVLASEDVPAGRYAGQLLDAAGVEVRAASRELDVRSVLAKVATGEADAGIVYATDAASSDQVRTVEVDGSDQVVATYPIAVLPDQAGLGRDFVDFVTSADGQAMLRDHGFGAP